MEWFTEEHQIVVKNEDGEELAKITFPQIRPGVMDLNHTYVSDALRGQGMAGKLTQKAYEVLKERDVRAVLTCSYAISWFSKHPECQDILEDPAEEARKAASLAGPACGIAGPA